MLLRVHSLLLGISDDSVLPQFDKLNLNEVYADIYNHDPICHQYIAEIQDFKELKPIEPEHNLGLQDSEGKPIEL